jgi:hypothetical protein
MATNGDILKVTDEKYVKYHAGDNFREELSFNLHGIAMCLTGNYENDVPTDAQMKALVLFIRDVQDRYKIDALVRGHKETASPDAPTACPGKNLGTSKSGWLKQVITNTNDPNYPQEPVMPPELTECEKRVKTLEEQLKARETELGALNEGIKNMTQELKIAKERTDFLESTMAIRDKELSDLEADYDRVYEESLRFEKQYIDAVTELNELKKGRDDWVNRLADILHKLFGMK